MFIIWVLVDILMKFTFFMTVLNIGNKYVKIIENIDIEIQMWNKHGIYLFV